MSGVYVITNLHSGKGYVGSAVNLVQRRDSHFQRLRRGAHHNAHLQAAFDSDGEDAFRFVVLALCQPKDLLAVEQRYINMCRAADRHFGYNARPRAESNHGRKCSPETIERMRRASTGRKQSPELIARRVAARGRVVLSAAHKAALIAAKLGKPRHDVAQWAPDKFRLFSDTQVAAMRSDRVAGMTFRALADKWRCNISTAHRVVTGGGVCYRGA